MVVGKKDVNLIITYKRIISNIGRCSERKVLSAGGCTTRRPALGQLREASLRRRHLNQVVKKEK